MGNYQTLLLLGLIFHISFIYSVFDCYFTSPVVHGMQRFSLASPAPAKRLVLIVGDGLRADLLFHKNGFPSYVDAPEVVAPYLRSIVEKRGAFGVSHTRVPTESRPGHVAIIAGMYEDVSAVTKGWKTNPVDFDSVFNQSSHTYSFGSPDILPMFARGAVEGRVLEWSYHEDDEDFTKDATALDTWVLDELRTLLRNASDTSNPHSAQLNHDLHQPKTIFFLHLLGLDTTGHSYRPFSKEYMHNIQVVDDIVKEVEALMKEFYGEEETAYVFTADHGMSLIGNHGDGHPDNTRTPVVAWGKGLRGPLPDTSSTHDEYSAPWELGHLYRQDLSQADLAPLMCTLLGLEWPVNSVGVLPGIQASTEGFLDLSDEEIASAAEVNAKMILEHYRVKHELKRSKKFFYKPFLPLEGTRSTSSFSQDPDTPSTSPIPILIPNHQHLLSVIENAISSRSFSYAREQAYNLIQLGLEGLRYIETYDRTLIRGIVVAAYLGWATYAALRIGVFGVSRVSVPFQQDALAKAKTISRFIAFGLFTAFCTMFYLEHAPWTYYIYIGWPIWFWGQVVGEVFPSVFVSIRRGGNESGMGVLVLRILGVAGLVVGALGCMVLGYTHRIVWSLGFLFMGVIWPLGFWPSSDNTSKDAVELGKIKWLWMGSCLANAVFPLLDVNKEEKLGVILSAGFLMLGIGGLYTWELFKRRKEEERPLVIQFCVQLLFIVLMMLATRDSVLSLQAKQGLPLIWQSLGWVVILVSPTLAFGSPITHLPSSDSHSRNVNKKEKEGEEEKGYQSLFHPNPITSRFMQYTLGLGPLFIILSISDEAFFFVCYSVEMWAWVKVEGVLGRMRGQQQRLVKAKQRQNGFGKVQGDAGKSQSIYQFTLSSLRIALFFLFFVQAAFFGTGNVASISSFYLSPVYRLIPVFNPFFMAVPLVCKIISPYVLLSIAVASLTHSLELPPFSLFLLALTITDGMTLVFFFMIRDTGSWLEIGQTISFFIITNLLTLWSGGVCAVGEYLMHNVLVRSESGTKVKVN